MKNIVKSYVYCKNSYSEIIYEFRVVKDIVKS